MSEAAELLQPEVVERGDMKLIGFLVRESLSNILESRIIGQRREELEARKHEIRNRVSNGIYLTQIYNQTGEWTHDSAFDNVVAYEVHKFDEIPNDMLKLLVPGGRFRKFTHEGPESKIGDTYEIINRTCGVRPYDIEYWLDIYTLGNESSRIELYIPLDAKGGIR